MPPSVNVGTDRLIDICADGRQALGKFAVSDLTARNSLVIETT